MNVRKNFETLSKKENKELKREPICNKKYLKAEKNHYKNGFHCICKRLILINSVYKKNENYYPRMFLEKYNFKKGI